jgi:hypothetical protein
MVKGKLAPQAFCVTGRYHLSQNFREHFSGSNRRRGFSRRQNRPFN